MANNQYQLPKNYSESDIRAQIDAIQYAPHTPEKARAPFQEIKDHSNKIFSYREVALATEKKPKGWLGSLVFKPEKNTIVDLIEKESKIGGELFGEGHRFWLDNRSNNTVFHNDVIDWYHLKPNENNPKKPTILRLQLISYNNSEGFEEQTLHKLYNGLEYAPTLQDIEIFSNAVKLYGERVAKQLYSEPLNVLDQTIDDLMQEDQSAFDKAA